MTAPADDRTARAASAVRAVEAVWRIESARIVATLTRVTGDFALAEDMAQEALAEALSSWPQAGVPANPGAWLVAVGKRRAVDHWRRLARRDDRYAQLAHELDDATEPDWDPDAIEDDVLRLIFVACHPVLSREASIALTLPGGGARGAGARRPPDRERRRAGRVRAQAARAGLSARRAPPS